MTTVLDRFLRYVTTDTRADDRSSSCPSTPGQLALARDLVQELHAFGIADATVDEHGYVMATVPATPGLEDLPAIGFLAHLDTSPEMPGDNVRPIVHRGWNGGDIVLPDAADAVLRAGEDPALAACLGHDIVTASGLTLLGGDDKAGLAEIMTAVAYLMQHDDVPHGRVRIGFTPDEEIGRGPDRFDVQRFSAAYAYTLDGGAPGELEYESFSADAVTVTFTGFNAHPGYAKGRMINAIKLAAAFIISLPPEQSPEHTDGYDGFLHPYVVDASVERTSVRVLLRNFQTAALSEQAALVERLARAAVATEPRAGVELSVEASYRNMREVFDRHPEVITRARDAIVRLGLTPLERPIRGGTDGSRLSFMGLPTPNLFAGEHNFHSRLEWVSRQEMELAVRAIVEICRFKGS